MKRTTQVAAATAAIWLMTAGPASATVTVEQLDSLKTDLNIVWVGVCAAMVFLMQLGFSMLEAGLVRSKNAANIVAKNVADMAIGAVAYWAVGAALAYGAGAIVGTNGFFNPTSLFAISDGFNGGTDFVFQLVFAATAATIVSGAVAERMKFTGYLIASVVITGLIYPIVTHFQWTFTDDSWLYALGFHDFAGSALVHMTGGVAAFVGAKILGPRIGKYDKNGKARAIPGHNVPFAAFGVFILWFGWFGFNGGSQLAAADSAEAIGVILVSTMMAGAAGGLVAGLVTMIRGGGKFDPTMAGNGILAGLVGITAGTNFATAPQALLIGAICGAVVVFAVAAFDAIKIDDPVGAISVHGVCGALGTLYVGVIAAGESNGDYTISLATQAIGVVSIAAFVAVTSAVLFYGLKAAGMLRVSEEEEIGGLDITEHGIEAYPAPGMAGVSASTMGASSAGAVGRVARPVTD